MSLVYSNGKRRRPDGTLDKGMRLEIDHDDLGITPDFRLTSKLAQLFQNNRRLIESHKQDVERKLDQHRAFFAREAEWKSEVLSYDFLIDVYGSDKPSTKAMELTLSSERSEAMRNLIGKHAGSVKYMHQRMEAVNRKLCSQWWYLYGMTSGDATIDL